MRIMIRKLHKVHSVIVIRHVDFFFADQIPVKIILGAEEGEGFIIGGDTVN